TYTASDPIPAPPIGPSVHVDYTQKTGGNLDLQALADAYDIPTGMTVTETSYKGIGPRKGTFTATGGSLGRIEGGFSNGAVHLPSISNPYLFVTGNGATQSILGRIDNLTSASIDASGDVTTDVQLGQGPREPFDAHADVSLTRKTRAGTTFQQPVSIDGHISNIPRHLHVVYSPSDSTVSYDANGETINAADVTMDSSMALFGRVKHIHASI